MYTWNENIGLELGFTIHAITHQDSKHTRNTWTEMEVTKSGNIKTRIFHESSSSNSSVLSIGEYEKTSDSRNNKWCHKLDHIYVQESVIQTSSFETSELQILK